jgi:hypothetical protein
MLDKQHPAVHIIWILQTLTRESMVQTSTKEKTRSKSLTKLRTGTVPVFRIVYAHRSTTFCNSVLNQKKHKGHPLIQLKITQLSTTGTEFNQLPTYGRQQNSFKFKIFLKIDRTHTSERIRPRNKERQGQNNNHVLV